MRKKQSETHVELPSDSPPSPFELAMLSVSLAGLKGLKEPDLEGAFSLLLSIKDDFYIESFWEESMTYSFGKGNTPGRVEWPFKYDAFPGAEKIKRPKTFPVSKSGLWRAILGKSPSRTEIENGWKRVDNSALKADFDKHSKLSEYQFWKFARQLIPLLPRYSEFYGRGKRKVKRSRKASTRGQITATPRDPETHRFIKKPN
jgi:hypothetical protein